MVVKALIYVCKQNPWYFLTIQISIILQTIAEMSIPLLIQKIIKNKGDGLGDYFGLILASALISLLFAINNWTMSSKMMAVFREKLQIRMYHKIQNLSLKDYDYFSPASLIRRITNNTKELCEWLRILVRIVSRSFFMIIFGIITICLIMFDSSSHLTANNYGAILGSIFVFIFITLTVLLLISLYVRKKFSVIQISQDEYINQVYETVSGIRFVKAYSLEKHKLNQVSKIASKIQQQTTFASAVESLSPPIIYFFTGSFNILILLLGASFLQISQITALIQTTYYLILGILLSSFFIGNLGRVNAAAKRVFELLNFQSQLPTIGNEQFQGHNYDLAFHKVTFTYPLSHQPALVNLSFVLKQGQTMGIIGKNGSGKSSILRLIAQLYQPQQGLITIGQQPMKHLSAQALSQIISVVPQKNIVFSGTIASNVRFGNDQLTISEIKQGLKLACVNFFTTLDDPVTAHGHNLSAGQKQRLCVARSLVLKRPILIFDDATSALDYQTESQLINNLKNNFTKQSKIIVSQKISSISHADLILVLDQGQLVAQGTHQQLLTSCQIYQEIYQIQSQ